MVAINRNRWSQSVGNSGRDQSECAGTTNELSGGSFVEGFVAGAVGAGARLLGASQFKGDSGGAIAGRVALASLAGGATAKVLGGKFENGAITGAFVALFYEWQSGSFDKPKPSAQFLRQEADSMNVGINVSVPDVVIKVVNFIESTNVAGDPILPVSSVEGGIIFGFPGPGDPEASFGAKFYGEVGIGADATLPVDGRGNFRAGAAIVGEYSPLNIDETVGDSLSGSVQFGPGGITGSLRPDGSFGSAGVVFGPGVGASVQGTTRCVASFADGINC